MVRETHANVGAEIMGRGGVTPLWLSTRRYGFAGPDEEIHRRLGMWVSPGDGRSFGPLRPHATPPIDHGTITG